jgi:hypothetical protein
VSSAIIGVASPRVKSAALRSVRGRPVIYTIRFALIALYTVFWGIPAMLDAPFSGEAVVSDRANVDLVDLPHLRHSLWSPRASTPSSGHSRTSSCRTITA